MRVLTRDLTRHALNWAVAKAEGHPVYVLLDRTPGWRMLLGVLVRARFDTDWSQGGPIIERERIGLSYFKADPMHDEPYVIAAAVSSDYATQDSRWCAGPTALVAAMRCYVVNKLGETVDIPEELLS